MGKGVMGLRFLFIILVFIFMGHNLFAQGDDQRLLEEARSLRLQEPQKALKLLDYLENSSDERAAAVQLEKMIVFRIQGNSSQAVVASTKIQELLRYNYNPEIDYRYQLERAYLFHSLHFNTQASLFLKKALHIYAQLPGQLQEKYRFSKEAVHEFVEKDLDKNYIEYLEKQLQDFPLDTSEKNHLHFLIAKKQALAAPEESVLYLDKMSLADTTLYLYQKREVYRKILRNKTKEVLEMVSARPELMDRTLLQLLENRLIKLANTSHKEDALGQWQRIQEWEAHFSYDTKKATRLLLQQKYDTQQARLKEAKIAKTKRIWVINSILIIVLISYASYKIWKTQKKIAVTADSQTTQKGMADKTQEEILGKLADFETSDKFLDEHLRLSDLAGLLHTNTRYLSTIINTHKGKSFNSYINSLRVAYIVQKLQSDPQFRNYKIAHLAKESGFASQSSFSTAFKEVTGESPSGYIRRIKG